MSTFRIFILSAFLLASFSSFAQVGGHFGVKAGVNSAKTAQDGPTRFYSRFKNDFHLGAMYRLRLNRIVLQPEALYSVKGGSFKEYTTGRVTRNNYNYLSLPLLVGYIPTEGLTFQAGPEFSYALNTTRTNGPAKKNDLGIVVGVHYDFLDLAEKFSLHLRYIHGLNDISGTPTVKYYNRTFQASIVYNFYRKK
ncbi:porin family protein [Larkinella soli]|uniref:porin family protein n=1 Tax=Larkinella soli TaxID=1770527 RepID=UPI000FFBA3E8|nr:porin family protein [Larkinella soli]